MRILISLLILIVPLSLFGQATIRISNKKTNETYFVLKSDTSIRQGSYKKWNWDNKLIIDGYYKHGKKDSVWTFSNDQGVVDQKYNYTKSILLLEIEKSYLTPHKIKIPSQFDSITVTLDKNPVYIGGLNVLHQFISDNLNYPDSAKWSNITGTVYITFTVSKNGNAINHKVIKGVAPILDKEAMRIVKSIPGDWIPGVYNGKTVDVPYYIPIHFEIR